MNQENGLLIFCVTLIIVLIVLFIFGIAAYKLYINNSARQLSKIVRSYEDMILQHLDCMKKYEVLTKQGTECMVCFIEHIEALKKHPIYKELKHDNT